MTWEADSCSSLQAGERGMLPFPMYCEDAERANVHGARGRCRGERMVDASCNLQLKQRVKARLFSKPSWRQTRSETSTRKECHSLAWAAKAQALQFTSQVSGGEKTSPVLQGSSRGCNLTAAGSSRKPSRNQPHRNISISGTCLETIIL